MSIGYRPKGGDGPLYHPERDYAYITPTLMRSAIEKLDAQDLPAEIKSWKQDNNITEAEIVAAAESLARAQRDFVNASDPVESLEHALLRRDFYDSRLCVRQFLLATIGEVFCAAWFTAVREVSKIGVESPAERGMAEFSAAVHRFATSAAPGSKCLDLATLQLRNDLLQTQISMLIQEHKRLKTELHKLNNPPLVIPAPSPATVNTIGAALVKLFNYLGIVK